MNIIKLAKKSIHRITNRMKRRTLDFSGQNIYVGLDTHLKNWRVSIVVEDIVWKTFSQDPSPEVLKNYLERNFPNGNYFSAYEASFSGFTAHRKLLEMGIKNIVVNPADVPTTDKDRKQKEDSRDSRKIAKQLSQNSLTAIYVPDIETEGDRSLIRYRKTISKEIARAKHRVKSQLYYFGIEIPDQFANKSYWSNRFTSWLKEVSLPTESARMTIDGHLETVEFFKKKQYQSIKEIRKMASKAIYKEYHDLLITIPGISSYTAMLILTELGAINRFKNVDQLNSYIGFVPMTRSSGERERTGDISSRSNKILRSALVESAWVAIRKDPALISAYQKLRKRMQPQKAIIRIAKKLVNRIRFVLKNKKAYEQAFV